MCFHAGVIKSSLIIFFFLSMAGFVQADVDDFSYGAFKQSTTAIAADVSANGDDFISGVDLEVFPGSISPSQNQLTQQRITNEFYYIVLLSGVALISLFLVLNFLKSHGQCPRDIVNAAGLILIIFGTIILVLVVDTTEQLTAAIGVLGAIAGYLFGTIQSDKQARPG